VVGVMLGLVYLARRFRIGMGSGRGSGLLTVLASRSVGTRQWILLLEAAGTPLVVGVSRDRIQLLSALDPSALSKFPDGVSGPTRNTGFTDQLQQALGNEKGTDSGIKV
jgi:flagellar biogenesis protein FliO